MVAAIEQLQDVINESKAAIAELKSETVNYKLGVDTMQGQLRHHTARVEKIETSLDRVVASSPIALDAAHAAPSPPLGDETRGPHVECDMPLGCHLASEQKRNGPSILTWWVPLSPSWWRNPVLW